MKITIPFFPTLNDSLIKDCGYQAKEFDFSFVSGGVKKQLSLKPITVASEHETPTFNLVDENGEWDSTLFSAKLVRKITITTPEILFGENGIAAHNASIGIAVLLSSLSSNHRYAIPVSSFSANSKKSEYYFSLDLPKQFFRDKISLRTILYLVDAGSPSDAEKMLASLPGTVLGTLDEIDVYIDGTGSLFPVKKESDPTKPLWRVDCDWSDPFNDLFNEDNVCVIFNQAHPNYGLLKIESGMNGSPFLVDVIASALQIIITKAVESAGGIDALTKVSSVPGSIADAVNYFLKTFGWNANSPEKLAETIRLDFDRRTGHDR